MPNRGSKNKIDPDKNSAESREKIYAKLIAVSSEDDSNNIMPMDKRRGIIESSAMKNIVSYKMKNRSTGNKLSLGFGYAIGRFAIAALILLLAGSAFVPLNYDRIIGYKVAFAGVDEILYDDDKLFCDLLEYIGLENADIDFQGCNTTCSLIVIDLESKSEAEMVIAAFTKIENSNLSTEVIPIQTAVSGTLLERANEKFLH